MALICGSAACLLSATAWEPSLKLFYELARELPLVLPLEQLWALLQEPLSVLSLEGTTISGWGGPGRVAVSERAEREFSAGSNPGFLA